MFELRFSGRFKKAYKLCVKRGLDPEIMSQALRFLSETGTVPQSYQPHPLHGDYEGCMECHLQSDWLLVWEKHDKELCVILISTGTHSDLFGKTKR